MWYLFLLTIICIVLFNGFTNVCAQDVTYNAVTNAVVEETVTVTKEVNVAQLNNRLNMAIAKMTSASTDIQNVKKAIDALKVKQ